MLQHLFIQNFALIDQMEIPFDKGLSVITGETGAGKSILLGALGLILGNRADHSSLKDNSRKCIVEGTFELSSYCLGVFFDDHDLDYSDQTILRREINGVGKSRSFINDTPCTLDVMKQLGIHLMDIHSQQQSMLINDAKFQLSVLDALASNGELINNYKQLYSDCRQIKNEIDRLLEQSAEAKRQEDYLNFQFQELESLNLKKGENNGLEEEQIRFANSEEVLQNLGQIQHIIEGDDQDLSSSISVISRLISNIKKYDTSFESLSERVDALRIELEDISSELESKIDAFEYQPERHQFVEERLAEIHRLQQKHLLAKADHLIELKDKIENQLLSISNSEGTIETLQNNLEQKEKELNILASDLTKKRLSIVSDFEIEVQKILFSLGIPYAQFKVEHEELDQYLSTGRDQFRFLFTANKGINPEIVSKSASGGETSRLMLAIKKILADHQQLPTILFDEIDTGVSGEIADKMGEILSKIGASRQVISITHLPQLAAKGAQHYYVYKEVLKERSQTLIKQLKEEERVEELAKMLSGKNLSEAAINNAKELLTL